MVDSWNLMGKARGGLVLSVIGLVALIAAIGFSGGASAVASTEDEAIDHLMVASEASHWPVDMSYEVVRIAAGSEHRQRAQFRFSGESWTDWQWEILSGEANGVCEKYLDGVWYSGWDGCDGQLDIIDRVDDSVLAGPTSQLFPGALDQLTRLQGVRGDSPPEDPLVGKGVLDHAESESQTFATNDAAACGSLPIRECGHQRARVSQRVSIDERTGFVLRSESIDRRGSEIMIVRSLMSGDVALD